MIPSTPAIRILRTRLSAAVRDGQCELAKVLTHAVMTAIRAQRDRQSVAK